MTLTEGNTLQVTCAAQCTPSCFYVWTLGQREIPSTNGVLNIPAVSAEQKGDYTCVAANGEGNQASKVLSVDVLCKLLCDKEARQCMIHMQVYSLNFTFVRDGNISMHCGKLT